MEWDKAGNRKVEPLDETFGKKDFIEFGSFIGICATICFLVFLFIVYGGWPKGLFQRIEDTNERINPIEDYVNIEVKKHINITDSRLEILERDYKNIQDFVEKLSGQVVRHR